LQSNQFDTTWTTTNSSVTSGQSGYDGSSDAWLLSKSDVAGLLQQTISSSSVSTFSVYLKAGTLNWGWIILRDSVGGDDASIYLDLSGSGALGTSAGGAFVDANIVSIGSGWFRCDVTNSGGYDMVRIAPADGNEDLTGTSGNIYIQDAQLEQGLVATDYIETGASTAKAGILENMPRLDYSGGASCPSLLLEPQRTNLVEYSEYFQEWHTNSNVSFSTNEATSPEGLTNATKLTATSTSNSYVRDNLNAPAGNNVFSVFAKYEDCQYISLRSNFYTGGDEFEVWFDIQNGVKGGSTGDNVTYNIEDYGNDWYRCYAVFNIDAGDTSGYCYVYLSSTDESFNVVNGTGALLYGGQLEAGSYPTSYIPTYGTSQTRSVDQMILATLNNSDSYTIFIDFKKAQDGGGSVTFLDKADGGAQLGRILMKSGALLGYYDNVNGYLNNDLNIIDGNQHKYILRVTNNFIEEFGDGSKQPNSITNTLDAFDRFVIYAQNNYYEFNQLLVFPTALTDSECIALTTL
jgi:hypothetical protein